MGFWLLVQGAASKHECTKAWEAGFEEEEARDRYNFRRIFFYFEEYIPDFQRLEDMSETI